MINLLIVKFILIGLTFLVALVMGLAAVIVWNLMEDSRKEAEATDMAAKLERDNAERRLMEIASRDDEFDEPAFMRMDRQDHEVGNVRTPTVGKVDDLAAMVERPRRGRPVGSKNKAH